MSCPTRKKEMSCRSFLVMGQKTFPNMADDRLNIGFSVFTQINSSTSELCFFFLSPRYCVTPTDCYTSDEACNAVYPQDVHTVGLTLWYWLVGVPSCKHKAPRKEADRWSKCRLYWDTPAPAVLSVILSCPDRSSKGIIRHLWSSTFFSSQWVSWWPHSWLNQCTGHTITEMSQLLNASIGRK